MRNHYLYIFLIILLGGCNAKEGKKEVLNTSDSINKIENNLFPIYIDKNIKYANSNDINIQDIGKIKYIRFETNKDCLLRNKTICEGVLFSDDNIFISYMDKIFRFDLTGKYINSIGTQGEGPNDFVSVTTFSINEKNKEILISDLARRRTMIYTYDGNYIRSISHEYPFDKIVLVNDSTMLCSTDMYGGRSIFFLSSLKNGQTTEIFLREEGISLKNIMTNTGFMSNIRFYNDNIMQTTLQDSIFSINKNTLELTARYIQLPSNKTLTEDKPKTLLYLLFETDHYANIATGRAFPYPETYIIDKKTNTITTGRFVDKERGEKIMPFGTNKDNIIVDLYDSFDLQKLLNENKLSGSLKQIAEELKEEDNPVLMIATLDS